MLSLIPIISVPQASCDCHVHVFDPDRFSYEHQRAYTPGPASLSQLQALHQTLGMTRTVLVQPSVYGSDNACLLAAMAALGLDRARGVAVLDVQSLSVGEMERLHEAGVRGIRLNLEVSEAGLDAARAQLRATRSLARMPGWHVQVHAKLPVLVALLDEMAQLGMPVVLDHYAGAGGNTPEVQALLERLLQGMRCQPLYVKLSAAYRLAAGSDPAALAGLFYQAAPSQVLWGSDWPHTGGSGGQGRDPQRVEPFRHIDNTQALQGVLSVLGGAQAVHQVLVDNPARLYGFLN